MLTFYKCFKWLTLSFCFDVTVDESMDHTPGEVLVSP